MKRVVVHGAKSERDDNGNETYTDTFCNMQFTGDMEYKKRYDDDLSKVTCKRCLAKMKKKEGKK